MILLFDLEVAGKTNFIVQKIPHRVKTLFAVDHSISKFWVFPPQIVEIELRDIVIVEKRVEEQLLLFTRPNT